MCGVRIEWKKINLWCYYNFHISLVEWNLMLIDSSILFPVSDCQFLLQVVRKRDFSEIIRLPYILEKIPLLLLYSNRKYSLRSEKDVLDISKFGCMWTCFSVHIHPNLDISKTSFSERREYLSSLYTTGVLKIKFRGLYGSLYSSPLHRSVSDLGVTR